MDKKGMKIIDAEMLKELKDLTDELGVWFDMVSDVIGEFYKRTDPDKYDDFQHCLKNINASTTNLKMKIVEKMMGVKDVYPDVYEEGENDVKEGD